MEHILHQDTGVDCQMGIFGSGMQLFLNFLKIPKYISSDTSSLLCTPVGESKDCHSSWISRGKMDVFLYSFQTRTLIQQASIERILVTVGYGCCKSKQSCSIVDGNIHDWWLIFGCRQWESGRMVVASYIWPSANSPPYIQTIAGGVLLAACSRRQSSEMHVTFLKRESLWIGIFGCGQALPCADAFIAILLGWEEDFSSAKRFRLFVSSLNLMLGKDPTPSDWLPQYTNLLHGSLELERLMVPHLEVHQRSRLRPEGIQDIRKKDKHSRITGTRSHTLQYGKEMQERMGTTSLPLCTPKQAYTAQTTLYMRLTTAINRENVIISRDFRYRTA